MWCCSLDRYFATANVDPFSAHVAKQLGVKGEAMSKKLPFDPANYKKPSSRLEDKVKFQRSSWSIGGAFVEPPATETQTAYASAPPVDLTQQIENRINTHKAKSTWRAHSFNIGAETQYPSYCAPIAVRGKARGYEPDSEHDPTPMLIAETMRRMGETEREDSMFVTQRVSSPTAAPGTGTFPKPVSRDIGCKDEEEILACKKDQYPRHFKGEYTLTTREDPRAANAANANMYMRHHLRAHHFDLGSYESAAQYMARVRARGERVPVDLDYAEVEGALRSQGEYVTTHNATYNTYNLRPQPGAEEVPVATLTSRSLYSPLPAPDAARARSLPRAPTPPIAKLRAPASEEPLCTTTELAHGQHAQVHPDNRKGYNNSWRVHRPPVFSAAVEDAFLTHRQRREHQQDGHVALPPSTRSGSGVAVACGPVVVGGTNNNTGTGRLTAAPRGLQYSNAARYFGPGVDADATATSQLQEAGTSDAPRASPHAGAGWSQGPATRSGSRGTFHLSRAPAPAQHAGTEPTASNGLAGDGLPRTGAGATVWRTVTQQSFTAQPVDPVQLNEQRERNRVRTLQHKYGSHITLGSEQGEERFRSETHAQYTRPAPHAMVRPQRYRELHEQTVLGDHMYQPATAPDHWRTSALSYD